MSTEVSNNIDISRFAESSDGRSNARASVSRQVTDQLRASWSPTAALPEATGALAIPSILPDQRNGSIADLLQPARDVRNVDAESARAAVAGLRTDRVGSVTDQQIAGAIDNHEHGRDIRRDAEPTEVTVGRGDSFWSIARRHLGKDASETEVWRHVQEIAKLNGLNGNSVLHEGQKLRLPGHDKDGGYSTTDGAGNKTTYGRDGSVTIQNGDGSCYRRGADGKEERWDKVHPRETEEQRRQRETEEQRRQRGQGDRPSETEEQRRQRETEEQRRQRGQGDRPAETEEQRRQRETEEQRRQREGDRASETEEQRRQRETEEQRRREGDRNADPNGSPEQRRLLETAERKFGKDTEEYRQFADDMRKFEERSKRGEVSAEEVKRTYQQVDCLLNADNAQVKEGDRKTLAQNIMAHAAVPTDIDQGQYNTCNVTTLQERLFTRNPSIAAEIIATTAIDGQWKAPDGKIIKIDRASLEPRPESRNHPPRDGDRSFATQVMNNVLVNDIVQRRQPPATYTQLSRNPDGSALRDGDQGERLFDNRGREILQDAKPLRSPSVVCGEMSDAITRLTGDRKFIIANGQSESDSRLAKIDSKADLDRMLQNMKRDGKLPATIMVDSNHPAFGGRGGREAGWHVVTITGYDEETGQVSISNQWGRAADHDMSLDDLYRSTRDHTKDGSGTRTRNIGYETLSGDRLFGERASKTNAIITDKDAGTMLYLSDRKSRDTIRQIEEEQAAVYKTTDWQLGPQPKPQPIPREMITDMDVVRR